MKAELMFEQAKSIEDRPKFKIWMKLRLGTFKNAREILTCIKRSSGLQVTDWAAASMIHMTISSTESEIKIVKISAQDLGFKKAVSRAAIYDCARGHGLHLVPAEVGPQLRIVYRDQPLGEWLLMGMEPIKSGVGSSDIFVLASNLGALNIGTAFSSSEHKWPPSTRWVFAQD